MAQGGAGWLSCCGWCVCSSAAQPAGDARWDIDVSPGRTLTITLRGLCSARQVHSTFVRSCCADRCSVAQLVVDTSDGEHNSTIVTSTPSLRLLLRISQYKPSV